MTSEEKELISTIKIAVIRGIVFADEEKLLELIKTAVGSNMSEKPTGSIHCQQTNAEIAKSFIKDVAAVKDQLPCSNQMDFPDTFDEFAKDYGFKDKDEVYTNGSELIPVFRVKQWLEHISTTKNNLAVDTIDRVELLRAMDTWDKFGFTTRYGLERLDKDDKGFVPYVKYDDMLKCVKGMSSVTPKGVTVTDFADKCRECGARIGGGIRNGFDNSNNCNSSSTFVGNN